MRVYNASFEQNYAVVRIGSKANHGGRLLHPFFQK